MMPPKEKGKGKGKGHEDQGAEPLVFASCSTSGSTAETSGDKSFENLREGIMMYVSPATTCPRINKTQLSNLPFEVLFDILSRLPVTTLIQAARYTCKLWRFIINDPDFAVLHLAHSLENPPGHLYTFSWPSLNVYFADNPTLAITLPGDLGVRCWYTCFGSCRGLLAYISPRNLSSYICNPIINDHVKIPRPLSPFLSSYGFGYVPATHKYKYVQFAFGASKPEEFLYFCGIFTLGEQYWREVVVPPEITFWGCDPVYCNGSLHWIARSDPVAVSSHVISFDLDTEKFRRRVFPFSTEPSYLFDNTYLTVIGQTVTLMAIYQNFTQEVWMLIDEGEDVWVKNYWFHFPIPRLDNNIMDFIFWELWMKRHENDVGPDSMCNEITRRGLHAGENRDTAVATVFKLPIMNCARRISPEWVIPHVGSLVSPSKIVKAAMKQS